MDRDLKGKGKGRVTPHYELEEESSGEPEWRMWDPLGLGAELVEQMEEEEGGECWGPSVDLSRPWKTQLGRLTPHWALIAEVSPTTPCAIGKGPPRCSGIF